MDKSSYTMLRRERQWKIVKKRAKLSTLIAASTTTIPYLDRISIVGMALLKEKMVRVMKVEMGNNTWP